MASEITLYDYFCGELFRHGVIMWRLNDEFNQPVVMNDYDSNSGNMKVQVSMLLLYDTDYYCIMYA